MPLESSWSLLHIPKSQKETSIPSNSIHISPKPSFFSQTPNSHSMEKLNYAKRRGKAKHKSQMKKSKETQKRYHNFTRLAEASSIIQRLFQWHKRFQLFLAVHFDSHVIIIAHLLTYVSMVHEKRFVSFTARGPLDH